MSDDDPIACDITALTKVVDGLKMPSMEPSSYNSPEMSLKALYSRSVSQMMRGHCHGIVFDIQYLFSHGGEQENAVILPVFPQLATGKQYVAQRLLLLFSLLPLFVFIFHLLCFLPSLLSHKPGFHYQKQQNRSKGHYFL